jgi:hypothetical protein
MAAPKNKFKVKLPPGSRIIVCVTDPSGAVLYIIYLDSQGNPHIIQNQKGASPID